MCEALISSGHNTEFRNPYKYSVRKLFKLSSVHRQQQRNLMLGELMTNHMSRVACTTGDAKELKNLIETMSEEE